jgi:hypothetical protein
VRAAVAALGVSLLGSANIDRFSEIAAGEMAPDDMFLASWVNTRYPDRTLYVAAFSNHAYEKLAYFVRPRRESPTVTGYHAKLLKKLDPTERYVYVVIFPNAFERPFQQADPRGRFHHYRADWGLFVN